MYALKDFINKTKLFNINNKIYLLRCKIYWKGAEE